MLIGVAASVGIGFLIEFLGVTMPQSVPLVITTMIPAWWAGKTWYTETNHLPESNTSWNLAFRFTAIQLALGVVMIGLFLLAFPEMLSAISTGIAALMFGAFVFIALMILVISRFFFPFGAKQAAKTSARK